MGNSRGIVQEGAAGLGIVQGARGRTQERIRGDLGLLGTNQWIEFRGSSHVATYVAMSWEVALLSSRADIRVGEWAGKLGERVLRFIRVIGAICAGPAGSV